MRKYFWSIIHNCIAHPLMGIFPLGIFFRFHDWTAGFLVDKDNKSSDLVDGNVVFRDDSKGSLISDQGVHGGNVDYSTGYVSGSNGSS